MRNVEISEECEEYIFGESSDRVQKKFKYLIQIIIEHKILHKSFVDKLVNTKFYELRIKAENQIRVIVFTIDHDNINESTRIILLNGFLKRTKRDYKDAIKIADKLLVKYNLV